MAVLADHFGKDCFAVPSFAGLGLAPTDGRPRSPMPQAARLGVMSTLGWVLVIVLVLVVFGVIGISIR
jgi:hypothetical protein